MLSSLASNSQDEQDYLDPIEHNHPRLNQAHTPPVADGDLWWNQTLPSDRPCRSVVVTMDGLPQICREESKGVIDYSKKVLGSEGYMPTSLDAIEDLASVKRKVDYNSTEQF